MKLLFTLLFGVLISLSCVAQPGYELGFNAGLGYYFGDLNTSLDLSKPGPAINVYGRYNFDERLSLKLGVYYARIKGSDQGSNIAFQRDRNLDFFSDVWDGTLQLEFNFFPYVHGSKSENFTPYLFVGLSTFQFSPKTKLAGVTYKLRDLGTEGQAVGDEYALFNIGMAYGAGLKWDLSYYWSMNVELAGRLLFTDYLDDVSTVYPDLIQLASDRGPIAAQLADRSMSDSGPLSRPGIQRGNSKNNDTYSMVTVGVAYFFGRVKCPPLSRPNVRKRKSKKRAF